MRKIISREIICRNWKKREDILGSRAHMLDLRKEAWQTTVLTRFVAQIFPLVERELTGWKKFLNKCPEGELKKQAAASIRHKRFHCQGGSFFALYFPEKLKPLVEIIVAVQTISDYLDNLCDRVPCGDEAAFRELHLSIIHALDPPSFYPNYYRYYGYENDGGYLRTLSKKSGDNLKLLPSYRLVKNNCIKLVSLYGSMQSYKHLDLEIREEKLSEWYRQYKSFYPDIYWWEFAAAAGSTLGVFMLLAASGDISLQEEEAGRILEVYFPWICGLHILLDYFIDQQEDKLHNDLNFVNYYADATECHQRLKLFLEKSLEKAVGLPHSKFHLLVIKGLLAMYLSDPKVERQGLSYTAWDLINQAGPDVPGMYRFCRLLRRIKVL